MAADLLERRAGTRPEARPGRCSRAGLRRLFPGDADLLQRAAAASSVLRRLAVVAGGPGHGQDDDGGPDRRAARRAGGGAGSRPPLIALAAPTGKAAARLQEAVHERGSAARHARSEVGSCC